MEILSSEIGVQFAIISLLFVLNPVNGGRELPCDFLDSVNITSGIWHRNRRISYNGIEFKFNQYAEIDYIFNGSQRIEAKPHTRGCPCINKPCVRLCCPYGSFVESMRLGEEVKCRKDEAAKNIQTKIIDENNQIKTVMLGDQFGFTEQICKHHELTENAKIKSTGDVSHQFGLAGHREYCLKVTADANKRTSVDVMFCVDKGDKDDNVDKEEKVEENPKHVWNTMVACALLISVVFISLTIVIYMSIRGLWIPITKYYLCYLVFLVIAFISMSWNYFNRANYMESWICKTVASLICFSFLSASLWWNVISYKKWSNFRLENHNSYSAIPVSTDSGLITLESILYALGIPLILNIFGLIFDSFDTLPNSSQSGIGADTCFLKGSRRISKLMFFLPLGAIFAANTILFVLILLKWYCSESLTPQSTKFYINIFRSPSNMRIFILTGMNWMMGSISFFLAEESIFSVLTAICNASLGVLIFLNSVLSGRIRDAIKNSWFKSKEN